MTSQLNRLKEEQRELSNAMDDTERRLIQMRVALQAAEERGYERVAQEIANDIDRARKEKKESLDRWMDVNTAIRVSQRSQFARLKTKGKRQAELLKAAIAATPGAETIDYAVATGLSEDRVRTLARILVSDGQIVRQRHSRWNGMHYLYFYTYYPWTHPWKPAPADDDLPF